MAPANPAKCSRRGFLLTLPLSIAVRSTARAATTGKGRVVPSASERYLDPSTEFPVERLTDPSVTSILPPPKYTHRWQQPPGEDSAFIHFIGTHRFEKQFYARQSRKAIKDLQRPIFRPGTVGVLT